ncbi:hypothetical protein [Virgibacillus phage Mimir87]|nr:hypothetical protein [Virgibacillus phage Mimir87]
MFNPYLKNRPTIVVYERNKECELCGSEINKNEYEYRGLSICPRCQEELEK